MKAHARLVLLLVAGMMLVGADAARPDWGPVERIAAVDGRIVDVSADRILYTTDFTFAIEDRASGNVTMINHVLNKGSGYGFLTSRGAILQFRHGSGSPDDSVYEWRDGQRIDLNQGPPGTQNYFLTSRGRLRGVDRLDFRPEAALSA